MSDVLERQSPAISVTTTLPAIRTLKLQHFRNYSSLTLNLTGDAIILTGANGSGKTNLLEAVSLLSPGRGFRNASLSMLDQQDGSGRPWSVFAKLDTAMGEVSIGTGRDPDSMQDKRKIQINGEAQRGQNALNDYLSVLHLTPQMDQTFTEGTTSRRSYLDRLTSYFFPEHTKELAIYSHAKSERMKLLSNGRRDASWLGALEARMAAHAVAIAAARLETVNLLQLTIDRVDSPFPKAILRASGQSEQDLEQMTALDTEEHLAELLAAGRAEDAASGRTGHGVHRSDFVVTHSIKQLPAEFCSTGEQIALLLSLTLAAARTKLSWSGSAPIVLLDEVVAHLDPVKRCELFSELMRLESQCWLTGTDTDFFADFQGNIQRLRVDNSTIIG